MANQNLSSMSIDVLLKMRDRIDSILGRQAAALRQALASIDGNDGRGRKSKRRGRKARTKYRDPKTGETWSGRGAPARWVVAYEKQGRKRDEYLIEKPRNASNKKGTKKRTAKKTQRKKRAS
jgi:DNA-binding protein H-NS